MTDVKLYPDNRCRKLRKRLAEKKSLPEEYFLFGNGAAELFFSVVLAEKPKHFFRFRLLQNMNRHFGR